MNTSTKLAIPCHWDREIIDSIVRSNQEKSIQVKEIYGVLAEGGPVGHGRARDAVVKASPQETVNFRNYLRGLGLNFTYLLNAPFKFDGSQHQQKRLDKYLDWILGELRPTSLMIASHKLMQYVRTKDGRIPIHISTIAGVKNVSDLEEFLDIKPSRVVVHHDLGKDWRSLNELVQFSEKKNIAVELMVTESCLLRCPKREAHYQYLARADKDAPFHTTCNTEKLTHPREFLLAGGIVRPEDVHLFEEMGIRHFKITGRSKPASWLPEVVEAYQQREYDGNLIRLLGIDPSMRAEDWIYLDNKALEGFLATFPHGEKYQQQVLYCDQWITRLYENGQFKLLDGSCYTKEGDSLVLMSNGGEKVRPIIMRERGR